MKKNDSSKKQLGIYLHVPFCRSKCLYCDFCSIPSAKNETVEEYINALCKQIETVGKRATDRVVDTVFIGGGTPTFLTAEQLGRVVSALDKSFTVSKNAEFTTEANPSTFDLQKLTELRALGLNRVSLGMQSAIPEELRLIGRTHRSEEIKKAGRQTGFYTYSISASAALTRTLSMPFSQALLAV